MRAYVTGEREARPWGSYEVIATGSNDQGEEFCKKNITVLPRQILSLQSHKLRREYWRVESGTLTVVLDGETLVLETGQSLNIPAGSIHCMANPGAVPCVVFERQEGVCREEDIIRYTDAYGRTTENGDDKSISASIAAYSAILESITRKTPQ